MRNRAPLYDHEFAFQHDRLLLPAGMRRLMRCLGRLDACTALFPAAQRQQQDAAHHQHADNDQAENHQHPEYGHANQQRKRACKRMTRLTQGRQGKMHVLKIRVLKSTTYVRNDGANRSARQVPMDTVSPNLPLCRLQDIPDGGVIAVDALLPEGEENLILLRRGEQVHAYLNICPHAGRQLDYAPGQFLLSKGTLICAVHGASFDQDDGRCIAGPCKGEALRSVGVRVSGAEIFLA